MNQRDRSASVNIVRVLMDQVRMEVDSQTLPSLRGKHLLADIKAIADRYARVLEQDAAYWRLVARPRKAAR